MYMYSIPWSEIAAHVVVGVVAGCFLTFGLIGASEWWEKRFYRSANLQGRRDRWI
jgi:hypothetical protein